MSLVERFTRDSVSKFVWVGLLLLAIVALAFAWRNGGRALDDERAASQARAVAYVNAVLEPRLGPSALSAPITGQPAASLETAVERSILVDERVARVRVWSTGGELLFSSDRADRAGSDAGLNDDIIGAAAREGALTRTDVSDTGGQDDPERSLVRTYAPIGAEAVVEIDQTDEGTLGLVRSEWIRYQLLAGLFIALFLVMTMLSLRDPIEPINVGVPFASSSIPAGYSLIDDDRLHAVGEVYRLAQERVDRLQSKLAESEETRRRLEGDIQRALSKAVSSRERPPAASVPAPSAPAEPTPEVPPTVVRVPESAVVPKSLGDAWAASAAAGPLARATRDPRPPPSTAKKAKAATKARAAEATPAEVTPAEPPAAEPPTAEAARDKPKRRLRKAKKAAPAPTPANATAAAPRPAVAPTARPVPAPAPAAARAAPTPARTAAGSATGVTASPAPALDPDAEDARAHEAALETFIRLTESDREPHDTTDVDQGAIRAALARTAARKKPGGERLQPHEGPRDESPDWRPRS